MGYLTELIGAAQSDTPVPELLRRAKVLGAFADAPELERWANQEIYGYLPGSEIPTYRGPFAARTLGNFIHRMGNQTNNIGIPPITFPKEYREGPLFSHVFTQGIAQIQAWADRPEGITFSWTPDAIVAYNMMVKEKSVNAIMEPGWGLVEAHMHAGQAVFAGVLDAARNTALDLALELHKAAPNAGEPSADSTTKSKAANVINNFFFNLEHADLSGSNNALGSTAFSQSVKDIPDEA